MRRSVNEDQKNWQCTAWQKYGITITKRLASARLGKNVRNSLGYKYQISDSKITCDYFRIKGDL
ncbi:hypothetical protein T03_13357 [Trichinella britovi]|uniref:Uncharacterized protein n=1 Tax=Trichinella britovi TaxID=45882 RepID=A0A0V1C9S7_TRIBR|nr:hypothetical protein T03_13357 [Trichinella britovi]